MERELPYVTNAEVLEAFAAVMPPHQVNALREEIGSSPGERCRAFITDRVFLVLAALSPEYAERIVTTRPDLADDVANVRRDPARYIRERRAAAIGDAP